MEDTAAAVCCQYTPEYMPNEGHQTFTHLYSAGPHARDATLIGAHICVTILAEQPMKMRARGQ